MDKIAAVEIAKNYLKILLDHHYPVRRMFLYGSCAKGNAHADSDIDLAIILNELNDPFQTQVNLLKLTWNFDTRVEPHPFDEQDFASRNPIIDEIIKTGVEISIP